TSNPLACSPDCPAIAPQVLVQACSNNDTCKVGGPTTTTDTWTSYTSDSEASCNVVASVRPPRPRCAPFLSSVTVPG
ncbi:Hypothetical predicted protein, partial [Pelobates cultripes]